MVLAVVVLAAFLLIANQFANFAPQGLATNTVCQKGDANLDGEVNVKGDLPLFLDLAFPTSTSTPPENTCCADVNNDGTANADDYNIFLAKIQTGEKLEFEGIC